MRAKAKKTVERKIEVERDGQVPGGISTTERDQKLR